MNPDRWQQIQDVFAAALQHSADTRDAYLRDACADDADLYREVKALLDADNSEHSLLDGVALAAMPLPEEKPAPKSNMIGKQIQAYRIVRQIGAGGMGAVYLAERDDGQFQQAVALKLIRRGMDSEMIIKRFQGERQILARLQHPNIARLLDGGLTDDGLPFFAMEYIEGLPITEYCQENRLSVKKRLALFQTVCEAVHYAHRNLIVHRDLKPGNIMVTSEGVVKLLDFGIAKALRRDMTNAGMTTVHHPGLSAMTPEYAAPEQVRGEAISTSTDVYSLGIILYELLTASRPYEIDSRSPVDIEKIVCGKEPSRPSTAFRQSRDTAQDSAEIFSGGGRITADLDNICLKALRKVPAERYGGADAFAADIGRYLNDLPVTARPRTWQYRAEKFLRRHWRGALGTAAALAAIIALTIFYTLQLAEERDTAKAEAEKAQQISTFLSGIFEASDPFQALGEDLSARALLQRGAQRIPTELAGQPEAQYALLKVISRAYLNLGLPDSAFATIRQAKTLALATYGDRSGEYGAALNLLGEAFLKKANYDSCFFYLTQATPILQGAGAAYANSYYRNQNSLGATYNKSEELEKAANAYREAIRVSKSYGDSVGTAISMNNLAITYHKNNQYAFAESLYAAALTIQKKALGPEHPEVSTTFYNYGSLLREIAKFSSAETMMAASVAIDKKVLGMAHPDLAYSLDGLSRIYWSQGKYQQGLATSREALAVRIAALGEDHPETSLSLNSTGRMLIFHGEYAEARSLLTKSKDIVRRHFGEDNPRMVFPIRFIGVIEHHLGNYDASEALLQKARQIVLDKLGENHRDIGNIDITIARLLTDRGELTAAEGLIKNAEKVYAPILGKDNIYMHDIRARRGRLYLIMGKLALADTLLNRSLTALTEKRAVNPDHLASAQANMGLLKFLQKDYATAENFLRAALDNRQKCFDENSAPVNLAKGLLAVCLLESDKKVAAAPLLRASAAALRQEHTPQWELSLVREADLKVSDVH